MSRDPKSTYYDAGGIETLAVYSAELATIKESTTTTDRPTNKGE